MLNRLCSVSPLVCVMSSDDGVARDREEAEARGSLWREALARGGCEPKFVSAPSHAGERRRGEAPRHAEGEEQCVMDRWARYERCGKVTFKG